MDAFVQLALIEKAKRVFAIEPDVDLCFPLLSPLTFTAAELAALAAPATPADYAAAADFARVVNFLPRGPVANASARMVWDIYRDVLDRADVASKSSSGNADQSGTDILYETSPDGSVVESAALKRYRQYRDAWFVAREDYASHKLSGELSDDPAVRQHWLDVEEPELRAMLHAAASDWETLGQRSLIELALKAERAAALNAPAARWAEWREEFNPDIDMVSDAGGNRYAPTGLSPSNFADQQEWLSFDLSAAEMQTLVDGAPEALKVVLGSEIGGRIQRVSFEYRSVALVRPWFRPEALTSRIWRSTDPDLALSDGAEPPNGTCPSYPAACVFVRNVVVTEKGKTEPKPFQDLKFTLDPKWFGQKELTADPLVLKRFQLRRENAVVPAPPPTPKSLRLFRTLMTDSFTVAVPSPARSVAIRAMKRRTALQAEPFAQNTGVLVKHKDFIVLPLPQPSPAPKPAPPPQRDELSILAFICKRLPRTPDPAPGLKWV